ncbi:hypothetical protein PRECH8_02220 [Insulibacter thermoxylanivorax]|uniref:Uncharacterized protein n=1 Tax=Insulibacter thermoxylanivorax TaxID=2749268 RepID=A0A916Q9Z8_9BACL|nr:hypothetical protein PRECH8_02220 [Insulibacter thermoxylanivorax]
MQGIDNPVKIRFFVDDKAQVHGSLRELNGSFFHAGEFLCGFYDWILHCYAMINRPSAKQDKRTYGDTYDDRRET